jgi:hypothetical protein
MQFFKHTIMVLAVMQFAFTATAQKYITRTGRITFFSATPAENIEAINNESAAALDAQTGAVSFQVPIRAFRFEKRLMEDHFNENYMESDKYPKASFSGTIRNNDAVRYTENGTYPAVAEGTLTIHGVARKVSIPGTITVDNDSGTVTLHCRFMVKPADHGIRIPAVVASKIAKEIEVTVNTILKKK